MKKYYPILLSKAGELTALSNLSNAVKNEIAPIIQIIPDNYDRIETSFSLNWAFPGNEVYLDLSLCVPFDRSKTRNLISNLFNGGVNVIPVLQQNSDVRYVSLLQALIITGHISFICIRFSNGSGGFMDINTNVASILDILRIKRSQTSILLDFGLVENHNYNMITALAANTILNITNQQDYLNIIVGSSSFPENLSAFTPPGRLYRLQRYEWDIWQTLQLQPGISNKIKYADYGTKYPFYSEANFQGTCSIKYTLSSEFIIYRGEISGNHPHGNGQYIIFAERLIRSSDYSGAGFSWGDQEIDRIAHEVLTNVKKKPGSAATWVSISQNHHITLLHNLL